MSWTIDMEDIEVMEDLIRQTRRMKAMKEPSKPQPHRFSDKVDKILGDFMDQRCGRKGRCYCGFARCLDSRWAFVRGSFFLSCWMFSFVLAIFSMVLGYSHSDDCPIDHRLPFIIMVAGFLQFSHCMTCGRYTKYSHIFFGWIASIFIVNSVKSTVNLEDRMDSKYCDPAMYAFGAWASIASLVNGSILGVLFHIIHMGEGEYDKKTYYSNTYHC